MEKIQLVKQITTKNIHDRNYINMNEITALDYENHLSNGGILELYLFIYDSIDDKENHRNYKSLIFSLKGFEKKGLRDKKNMAYRYKIVDRELISEDYSNRYRPTYQIIRENLENGVFNFTNILFYSISEIEVPSIDFQDEKTDIVVSEIVYLVIVFDDSLDLIVFTIFDFNNKREDVFNSFICVIVFENT